MSALKQIWAIHEKHRYMAMKLIVVQIECVTKQLQINMSMFKTTKSLIYVRQVMVTGEISFSDQNKNTNDVQTNKTDFFLQNGILARTVTDLTVQYNYKGW